MVLYYSRSGVEIWHGDALEAMRSYRAREFALCLTDPPYGVNIAKRGDVGGVKFKKSDWDAKRPPAHVFSEIQRVGQASIIWGGNYFADLLPPSRGWLVWHKRPDNRTSFADCELAWTSLNANARVLVHLWNGFRKHEPEERFSHPTQKPLRLMRWCLDYASGPASVIDPFCGTGTTLLAAAMAGSRAVGVDAEESYCEISARRLEAYFEGLC